MIDSNNPTALYPSDHAIPGCLPRKFRPGERCPMLGEQIKIIPSGEWDAAAKDLGDSLPQHITHVLDQDGVGSCATEATAGSVMLSRSVAGMESVLLNPWSIYATTSGGRDGGSAIDDNLAFAREYGICPESIWPRSKGWRAKPSAEAMEEAKKFKIVEFYE
jgi:hypothetical protein